MDKNLKAILTDMVEKKASDLHITANSPMHYRIDNDLIKVEDKSLTPEESRDIILSLMDDKQIERFEREKELDFSFTIENVARFRANAFYQRFHAGCAIRMIPFEIMSIEDCMLPGEVVRGFCRAQKGLVLITGATGSGKSTTLAAMVDEINNTRKCHIVTVEDPIEFIHENKKSIIDQRQIEADTYSYSNALTYVLRQDPDVILIGELRDLTSIMQALIIADTGHLVLATLHTSDCTQTINRIIDVFPPHQQKQVRNQLSFVLLGSLSQQLIPYKEKSGRILASEVLVSTPAVRSLIREAKEHQIYSVLQTSQKYGMKTMNQSLSELYGSGQISYENAISRSLNPEDLIKQIG